MKSRLKKGMYVGNEITGIAWVVEAAGPKRVLLRRLMSSSRFYENRDIVEKNVRLGYWSIAEEV